MIPKPRIQEKIQQRVYTLEAFEQMQNELNRNGKIHNVKLENVMTATTEGMRMVHRYVIEEPDGIESICYLNARDKYLTNPYQYGSYAEGINNYSSAKSSHVEGLNSHTFQEGTSIPIVNLKSTTTSDITSLYEVKSINLEPKKYNHNITELIQEPVKEKKKFTLMGLFRG